MSDTIKQHLDCNVEVVIKHMACVFKEANNKHLFFK